MKRTLAWTRLAGLLLALFGLTAWVHEADIQKPNTTVRPIANQPVKKAPTPDAKATPKAIAKPKPQVLKGKTIVLDAGHGGTDPGAVRGKVKEGHVTLRVVLALKMELEALGAKVILTRANNVKVTLQERVAITSKVKPDIFVSVHVNSGGNVKADGIEAFYTWQSGARLAYPLFYALSCKLGAAPRYVHKRGLYVTKYNRVPATLVEIGYVTNATKRAKLSDEAYRVRVAQAIAHGITLYFRKRK